MEKSGLIDLITGVPIVTSYGFLGWSSVNILVSGNEYALFDTGGFTTRTLLIKRLRELKIDRLKIRHIFLSHLHFDHCINVELFPKATIYVGKKEIDYIYSNEASERGDIFIPYPYINRIRKDYDLIEIGDGESVFNGVKAIALPGHTPGSMGYLIENEKILIAGDALKNFRELITKNPSICYDSYDTWKQSLDKILKLAKIIVPGHDKMIIITDSEFKHMQKDLTIELKFAYDYRERIYIVKILDKEIIVKPGDK